MPDQGHGGRNALLTAIIGALTIIAAAFITPIVQKNLDNSGNRSEAVATIAPTPERMFQGRPESSYPGALLRTTEPMTLRKYPWSDAAVIQVIPTGSNVSPGLERMIDNDGNKWMKISVSEGPTGWVPDPPSVEAVIEG